MAIYKSKPTTLFCNQSLPGGWKPSSAMVTRHFLGVYKQDKHREVQRLVKYQNKFNCLMNWTRAHLLQNDSTCSALEKAGVDTAPLCLAAYQLRKIYLAPVLLQDCISQLHRKSLESELKISLHTWKFMASCKSGASVVVRMLNSLLSNERGGWIKHFTVLGSRQAGCTHGTQNSNSYLLLG